jgi:hypothetical protein
MAVLIRQWQHEDLPQLTALANNIHIWNNLRNYFPNPYTEEDGRAWLDKATVEVPLVNMAIGLNEDVVGGIGLILNTDVYI